MDNIFLQICALIVCFGALFISATAWRVARKAKNTSKAPTYSKSTNSSIIESGLYVEHGMINHANEKSVRPEHKVANSFYESLH